MIIPLSWFNHLGKKREEKYICYYRKGNHGFGYHRKGNHGFGYYRKGNPGFSQFASENAQTSSHKERSHPNQEQGMI